MLTRRLIACFDIINGRVTKAQRFEDNVDVAPAEELAAELYAAGIDEIVFYDIMASAEKRSIDLETVRRVAACVFIPFTAGGGIASLEDMYRALHAGCEKVSIDSAAVRNPTLIAEGAKAFSRECIMLSTQVKAGRPTPSGYEVFIDGARVATGLDALEWIQRGAESGAGEICINSIDRDGTLTGYDIDFMKMAESVVNVPLIASGGAGKPEHLESVFRETGTGGAIISSMLYSPRLERNYTVSELKDYLSRAKIPIRPKGAR